MSCHVHNWVSDLRLNLLKVFYFIFLRHFSVFNIYWKSHVACLMVTLESHLIGLLKCYLWFFFLKVNYKWLDKMLRHVNVLEGTFKVVSWLQWSKPKFPRQKVIVTVHEHGWAPYVNWHHGQQPWLTMSISDHGKPWCQKGCKTEGKKS